MKSVDLAYAAGIIDGEGSIKIFRVKANQLNRKTDRFQLQVQVDMVNPIAINWLCKMFGGKVYEHKRNPISNWNDSKRWYIITQQAATFLKLILPYMKVKKSNAILCIEFAKLPRKDSRKIKYYLRNKELNKRGRHNNT